MATLGAIKADQIIEVAQHVVAIELVTAAQAVDLRQGHRLGRGTSAAHGAVRTRVDFMSADLVLAPDVANVHNLVADGGLLQAVNAELPHRIGLALETT